MNKNKAFQKTVLALIVSFAYPVVAQNLPDAGSILQDNFPLKIQPMASSVEFRVEGQPLTETDAGGMTVTLRAIRFVDNSIYSNTELMALLGDVLNKDYDLAGFRQLANQISIYYRANGYPFARAIIPAQNMNEGMLVIQLVEGRYGKVMTSGDLSVASDALPFLNAIKPGNVIESTQLERSTLLLGDLPGTRVVPVMRPSEQVGAGDLDVQVVEGSQFSGSVSLDNYGSRFSGEYRNQVSIAYNRLFMLGDELTVRATHSNEGTWLGQVGYSLPLGYSGFRGSVSYAHTDYTLGSLQGDREGTGYAKILSVGLNYPILRSQGSNISVTSSYQHKRFEDETQLSLALSGKDNYHTDALPISVQFDHRDSLLGGGVTYGALTFTSGRIKLGNPVFLKTNNRYSFTKTNLQIARLQSLSDNITMFGNISSQYTDTLDLDGSESFSLGGPNGVRAFPVGEGSDGRGWAAQLELRYAIEKHFTPYAFYDAGSSPRGGADADRRRLAGAGIGLRHNRDDFTMDLNSSWKVEGHDANSDAKQRNPRVWLTISHIF